MEGDSFGSDGADHADAVTVDAELESDFSSSLKEAGGIHLHGNTRIGIFLDQFYKGGYQLLDGDLTDFIQRVYMLPIGRNSLLAFQALKEAIQLGLRFELTAFIGP